MKQTDNFARAAFLALAILDAFIWYQILFAFPRGEAELYFLDVGQGDAELLLLPPKVKVLTDAGPDRKIVRNLETILPLMDRRIDLAVISHPQLDHFNGFNYLLERYEIGAFLINGRLDASALEAWDTLLQTIRAKNIPLITVGAGDSIRYRDNRIDILAPAEAFLESAELNDTGIVELIQTRGFRALLTGDIGTSVEQALLPAHRNLRAHILKVPHHGSKYSAGESFLGAIQPQIAVIEVGQGNRYGHPAPETILRLEKSGVAKIFRTDRDGIVFVRSEDGKLRVFRRAEPGL